MRSRLSTCNRKVVNAKDACVQESYAKVRCESVVVWEELCVT